MQFKQVEPKTPKARLHQARSDQLQHESPRASKESVSVKACQSWSYIRARPARTVEVGNDGCDLDMKSVIKCKEACHIDRIRSHGLSTISGEGLCKSCDQYPGSKLCR